ncbi:MAG: hypothetical protein OIF54_15130, partial [Cohaesibacter sp.]|nr:hypothetical protein [Cohaesibacter sp.]
VHNYTLRKQKYTFEIQKYKVQKPTYHLSFFFLTGIVLTVWGLCWYNFAKDVLGKTISNPPATYRAKGLKWSHGKL